MIYRISADGLLHLAGLASQAPDADLDTILAIVRGADPESTTDADPQATEAAKPSFDEGEGLVWVKPAKPE